MKTYGKWQLDAKAAISSILAGRQVGGQWELSRGASLTAFRATPDERWSLLRFGSVSRQAEYPFFPRLKRSLSLDLLDSEFPAAAAEYNDSRTNKSLAEAVAVQEGGSSQKAIRVIMVSDFLADADLSPGQLAFVNEAEAKVARYTDATLSWSGDRRVQIKLLRFVVVDVENVDSVVSHTGSLRLLPPRLDDRTGNLTFAWTLDGSDTQATYDLRVRSTADSRTVFDRGNLTSTSVVYPRAASGKLTWTVMATLPDGKTIERSAIYTAKPTSSSGVLPTIVLFLAILALAGAGIYTLKRKGLPDFMSALKQKNDSEI